MLIIIICLIILIGFVPIWPHTQSGEWWKDSTYKVLLRMLGLERTGPSHLLPDIQLDKNLDKKMYTGKIEEIISYIDHPVILLDDITIKYLGSTDWTPSTEEHVATSGFDKFNISASNGKNYNFDWSSGTGELPGPSYFRTSNGCYELHVNIIEKEKLTDISGRLVLYKASNKQCDNSWIKDLR